METTVLHYLGPLVPPEECAYLSRCSTLQQAWDESPYPHWMLVLLNEPTLRNRYSRELKGICGAMLEMTSLDGRGTARSTNLILDKRLLEVTVHARVYANGGDNQKAIKEAILPSVDALRDVIQHFTNFIGSDNELHVDTMKSIAELRMAEAVCLSAPLVPLAWLVSKTIIDAVRILSGLHEEHVQYALKEHAEYIRIYIRTAPELGQDAPREEVE